MATAESVKAKLQGLLDKANGVTGKADTDLTTAVNALIGGFGQGGDGASIDSLIDGSISAISYDGTTVKEATFFDCVSLSNVSMPNVTKIGKNAFKGCTGLESITLPALTSTGQYAFAACSNLKSVSLPSVTYFTSAQTYIFQNCAALEEVDLPLCEGYSLRVFQGCISLKKLCLPSATYLGSYVFQGCSALTAIVLPVTTQVVSLTTINAFEGTPFAEGGTGGTVYVPEALIPEYQAATNWATLYAAGTCSFVAIEGSEYE